MEKQKLNHRQTSYVYHYNKVKYLHSYQEKEQKLFNYINNIVKIKIMVRFIQNSQTPYFYSKKQQVDKQIKTHSINLLLHQQHLLQAKEYYKIYPPLNYFSTSLTFRIIFRVSDFNTALPLIPSFLNNPFLIIISQRLQIQQLGWYYQQYFKMSFNFDCEPRTYFISSCNNLTEVRANKRTAVDVLDLFCTVKTVKDYSDSSLIKIENHQISEQLLNKVLLRTLSDDIELTEEEEKILEPYSERLQRLSDSSTE